MARKAFLLRIDEKMLASLQQWAEEDLRSLNGQIEYLLKQALIKRGIKKIESSAEEPDDAD